jgi:hypothetical protein
MPIDADKKKFTDLSVEILQDDKELALLRDDKRHSADEDIRDHDAMIDRLAKRHELFLESEWQEDRTNPICLSMDDRLASFASQCFYNGAQKKKTFANWRRAQSFGMPKAEHAKQVAARSDSIKAKWLTLSSLGQRLESAGASVPWPPQMPPEAFLGWDQEKKELRHHARFLHLHKLLEREVAANDDLRVMIQRIENEERNLAEYVRLMRGNELTPPAQLQDVEGSLARCGEMRRNAANQRDADRRSIASSLALYAACKQFLHDRGVTLSPQFLLLGQELTVAPFVEHGPPRITPLATTVRVV